MRQMLAAVLALASAVTGCCGLPGFRDRPDAKPTTSPPISEARASTDSPAPGQVIVLDVALIERPRHDLFLDQDLWGLGNEQGVDLETKPALEENGLRVGQIGGLLPARLQALLTSPRSCPDPRRLPVASDHPAPVKIGGNRQQITFTAHETGTHRTIDLADAECFFEVTPTLESNSRVRLRFTPRVRYGKSEAKPRVTRDADGALGWAVEAREPVEEFPSLSWELTVGAGEYVLVGPRLDRADTLGTAYFLASSDKGPTRKLLVLKATPMADQTIDEALQQAPPLALQASWTSNRAGR